MLKVAVDNVVGTADQVERIDEDSMAPLDSADHSGAGGTQSPMGEGEVSTLEVAEGSTEVETEGKGTQKSGAEEEGSMVGSVETVELVVCSGSGRSGAGSEMGDGSGM